MYQCALYNDRHHTVGERVEYMVVLVVYIPREHYHVNGSSCTVKTPLLKMIAAGASEREGGMYPEHKCSSGTLSQLFVYYIKEMQMMSLYFHC